jgi:uncharacterized protein YidB (DUF937 family)
MIKSRFLRIALPVGGAVLVAAAAVAITASAAGLRIGGLAPAASATPSTTSPATGAAGAACQDYLAHLSGNLGVGQAKLESAAGAAATSTIEDQVGTGAITQAQADKIVANLPSSQVCPAALAGLGRARAGTAAAGVARMAYVSASASALGVNTAQLQQDLKNGQTLSQVATAQGVTEDEFKAKIIATLKPELDAAVGSGKLTQAKEDASLGKLQSGDPPLWTSTKN